MTTFRCVIHGSFSKHFSEIVRVSKLFEDAGIEVLAPKHSEIISFKDGFALFEDEQDKDPRLIELLYLDNLRKLGTNGFSYFVNPDGYIGKSASYELGIAQATNVKCFFSHKLSDHPAYIQAKSVWSAENLCQYIKDFNRLPIREIRQNEKLIHKMWENFLVPGSIVATGAIIEHENRRGKNREILLVKTHKWGNRYSIVGGKVRRNERLESALLREVKEETGLNANIGKHICTFDQIKNSGYYNSAVQHIFVDNVVTVKSKRVKLNYEAQDYIWALPSEALRQLDIEPNARKTLELYSKV